MTEMILNGEKRTYAESDEDTSAFHHVCHPSADVGYPTRDRDKLAVEEMYAPINIRDKHANCR